MKKKNSLRFLGLDVLTAGSTWAAITTFRAMQSPEVVPPADALESGAPSGRDSGRDSGAEWPFVSIIVPARNEARNLSCLLPTLLGQRYPNFEVIVVDDQSTDATPRILAEWAARDPRLHVVAGRELPRSEGWLGKPYAMQQGAQVAGGEWLLFTDADTTHSPLSLSSSMAFAIEHDVDLFTIAPGVELGSFAEKLIMPVAYEGISVLYPAYKVNDPDSSVAIANGQYILIRRQVYDAVGGIGRVKDKIAEDLEFGKAVKGDGYRLYLADGRLLMSVRMYTNFGEVWEGWSKNVVLSFRGNPLQALFSVLGIFAQVGLPFVLGRWAYLAWQSAHRSGRLDDKVNAGWVSAIAAWNISLPFYYRYRVDKALGLSPLWTLTQPVGVFVFALIMLSSLIRILTGKGVTWKGRTYAQRK